MPSGLAGGASIKWLRVAHLPAPSVLVFLPLRNLNVLGHSGADWDALTPARQVNGKWLLVLSGFVIIISIVFVGYAFKALGPASNGTLFGTMFVNEGGYADASSGATASYNVTLTAQKGTGSLLLTFLSGKDLVQNHLLSFSNYTIATNQVTMVISGHSITMPWEDNDTVWNHRFDSNYIASWGPSAPAAEIRGQVAGSVFGLPTGDYVEFRFAAQSANVAHGY